MLRFPLLHTILAEMADAGLIELAYLHGGMRFRNRDESDFFRAAPRARGGALDAFTNARQIRRRLA